MPRDADFKQRLCADINGFSLHAAVHCGADDRLSLEQLCRYITRPALANDQALQPTPKTVPSAVSCPVEAIMGEK